MNPLATLATSACLGLAACASYAPLPPLPQESVDAFAVRFLDTIQAPSINARKEFCGYIRRDSSGALQATPPRPGTFASCQMPAPLPGSSVIATYHTHGAYGPNYDNETPSSIDLESDAQLGLNGYVSTPGGRVWRTNPDTLDTVQICGLGCVTRDPGFVPRNEAAVLQRFTLAQLQRRNLF